MRTQLIVAIDSISRLTAILAQTPGEVDFIVDSKACDDILVRLSDAKEQLKTTPRHFDARRFGDALKNAIGDRSLREVAVEVGVSISTLSRLTLGNKPDIDTFATVCYWMNTLPIDFFTSTKSTPAL